MITLLGLLSWFVFGTWTTPRTWVPGELVTASMMNTHVRDNINSIRSEHFPVQGTRGMHLQSHPDKDVTLSQVQLVKADEIVCDDATRFADVGILTADLTASGAGGLDTGTEGASRWYEVYFIAKDDGTKNLLLHRAKNYLNDTSFTTARDASRALRRLTSTATDKLAQGIQFANAGPLNFIDVELIRAGSVSGRVWFSIQASTSGDASGTPLATTDKIDAGIISTSAQIIRIPFRSPFTVAAATQYHLVMEGDYAKSDTVNIAWRGVAAGGYSNGVAREYNGSAWANASGVGDFHFNAYITQNDAAVTMPSGYTKKAKIGWVFNNSSSDLVQFRAFDRTVTQFGRATGTFSNTVNVLLDASSLIPPIPVMVQCGMSHDTADGVTFVAGLVGGYNTVNNVVDYGGIRLVLRGASNINPAGYTKYFSTEYQAVYVLVGSGTGQAWFESYIW